MTLSRTARFEQQDRAAVHRNVQRENFQCLKSFTKQIYNRDLQVVVNGLIFHNIEKKNPLEIMKAFYGQNIEFAYIHVMLHT